MTKKAIKSDWKTLKMPKQRSQFDLNKRLTLDEYNRVEMGLVPRMMEDKCFIFLEGLTLYFHRSWTGNCVYTANVEIGVDHVLIGSVTVNRDPNQYKETDDLYDEKLLSFLIDRLLLGKKSEYPSKLAPEKTD